MSNLRSPRIPEQKHQSSLVLNRIAEIDSTQSSILLCGGCGWNSGFPIEVAGQLANLFAPSLVAHCLRALPGRWRGLLHLEVVHDFVHGPRGSWWNNRRGHDHFEVRVCASRKVALQETAAAGDGTDNWRSGP